ncbi:hypothetical protein LCGC14_1562100 [marine sediment metagenome]|uniref:Uncharacterized protein n=1 Tax=marine sediment metagenome TaxID=412755 RepID=A0A0F9IM48_9ZZZZ
MAPSKRSARRQTPLPAAPDPVDVVDGVPDRSSRPAAWKLAVPILIYLAWVCFLVISRMAGRP